MASAGKGLFSKRWALANELWQVNVAAEFGLNKPDPSPVEQFGFANASGIPLVIIFGEAELTSVRSPGTSMQECPGQSVVWGLLSGWAEDAICRCIPQRRTAGLNRHRCVSCIWSSCHDAKACSVMRWPVCIL